MESPSNVKAIMARFNTGPGSTEGPPGGALNSRAGSAEEPSGGGRPKVTLHPTLSSGPPTSVKKQVLEGSLSVTGGTPPKPSFLKSATPSKSSPDVCEFPRPKPLPGKFGAPLSDNGRPPAFKPKPPDLQRDSEPKPPHPKVPAHKPALSTAANEEMTCPKPPPALTKPSALNKPPLAQAKPSPIQAKPSWVKDDAKGEDSGGEVVPPKMPLGPKPKSSFIKMKTQVEEAGSAPVLPNKSASFRAAQNRFGAQEPESSSDTKPSSQDPPGPRHPVPNRSSFVKAQRALKEQNDPAAPKRIPLLNKLALGSPPAKPNRPPSVNLEKFRKQAEPLANGPGMKKEIPPPPLPPPHHGNSMAPPLPLHNSAPSLPPRPPQAIIQPDPDENYDDVGVMSHAAPPPPGGHPSRVGEDSGSDGETYEDPDERRRMAESKEQDKKREKEEKKRIEQEKREQREREKKEQEAKKKFKLSGPIQVIHKLKVKLDCKGSRTDLALKQGDLIEIIRISENPEGRWLGRTREGSIGYVKTESVEIDFDSLKRQGEAIPAAYDPEVYDDIGVQDDVISVKGPGGILPPPPEDEGELYDALDDLDLNASPPTTELRSPPKRGLLQMITKNWDDWRKSPASNNEVPPPLQFSPEGNAEKPDRLIDEEIYDDVDSQPPPPPPVQSRPFPSSLPTLPPSSLSSLLQTQSKARSEEKDLRKPKRFEKEEKDFRKKFKYDGEIQVLYRVTIVSTLTNKKWAGKDLALRPGETIDVIVKPTDNKLIGRNEEGKFGYVSTSHIVAEDADIYDDIGEDCIYDND
ncbi:hypothetical protein GJAV_G00049940 [Gymnothorax javanicus]|nr:hypothetical protein GJAV_G00049940 [Gymnothorax javanicus]